MACNSKKIILIRLFLVAISLLLYVFPAEAANKYWIGGTDPDTWDDGDKGEVKLTWSAPGDDGSTGDINGGKYRIDYSTNLLYHFITNIYKIEFSTDTSAGEPQSSTLNSLNQTTYYIRVYTADTDEGVLPVEEKKFGLDWICQQILQELPTKRYKLQSQKHLNKSINIRNKEAGREKLFPHPSFC